MRVWTASKPCSDHFFSRQRKDDSKQDLRMKKKGLFLIRERAYTKQPLISDQNFLVVCATSGPFCGLSHSGCIVVPWLFASLKGLPLKCTMKLNVNKTRTTSSLGGDSKAQCSLPHMAFITILNVGGKRNCLTQLKKEGDK